jgi:hypothetical protein
MLHAFGVDLDELYGTSPDVPGAMGVARQQYEIFDRACVILDCKPAALGMIPRPKLLEVLAIAGGKPVNPHQVTAALALYLEDHK